MTIFWGLMIPFIGTTLGALCVLFIKNELKPVIQKSLLGFAAGVMVAASVWSLLIPAMEMSDHLGQLAFLPAAGDNSMASGCGWIFAWNCFLTCIRYVDSAFTCK